MTRFLIVLIGLALAGCAPSDQELLAPPNAVQHWGTDEGLPAHSILDIRQAPDGYLWLATTAGLIRFDGRRFTLFDTKNSGLANPRLSGLRFTKEGGIRVFGEDYSVMESPTRATPWFSPVVPPKDQLGTPAEDKDGRTWVLCPSGGDVAVCRVLNGSAVRTSQKAAPGAALVEDRQGDLWTRARDRRFPPPVGYKGERGSD